MAQNCNPYNPEHERTCRHCYKKLQTKDGVLEESKFSCADCHKWWKYASGMGITILILLFGILIFLIVRVVDDSEKKSKKDDHD